MEPTTQILADPTGSRGPHDEALGIEGTGARTGRSPSRPERMLVPPPPESLEEAGLSDELVAGLVLKALYVRGTALGFDLVDMLALPMSILDDVLQHLQEQRWVEVHATKGPRRGEYVFKLTGGGRKRAAEELELSRYVGPAPVPFEDFLRWVEIQTIERMRTSQDELERAFEGVVVPDPLLEQLGPAINSGRSLFLFGAPGNGKTLLAERIAAGFGDRYYVPFSVLVDGSIMIVHDPVHHRAEDDEAQESAEAPVSETGLGIGNGSAPDGGAVGRTPGVPAREDGYGEPSPGEGMDPLALIGREIFRSVPEHDRRFAAARRPVVVTGGELTLEQLDLQWDPTGRMYQAPPQLKAAGGVLVVDDLGRQRVPVPELLNRWVVPLEQRRDYLTLRSGRKIVVPFDCFVVFSTNLEPRELTDEAFLRRIHYKIRVPDPCRDEYERIFRSACVDRGIEFTQEAVDYLFEEFYATGSAEPRRCHPRDVLDHVQDLAAYRGEPAQLGRGLLEIACRSYFLP